MLERDRRRRAHAKHARKLERKRWHEVNDKWRNCPNHHLYGHENYEVVRQWVDNCLELVDTPAGKRLKCHACESEWIVHADFRHP